MSTIKATPAVLDRIKRSELPNTEVYVAEKPRNSDTIGDEDFPMSDEQMSYPKRAARTNPILFDRLKEQEAIASGMDIEPEKKPERGGDLVGPSYLKFALGGLVGFLLILAFRNNDWIRAILKKLF